MYALISVLAGASNKIYDDFTDNILLHKFRNETVMEFLKGIHYILIAAISM